MPRRRELETPAGRRLWMEGYDTGYEQGYARALAEEGIVGPKAQTQRAARLGGPAPSYFPSRKKRKRTKTKYQSAYSAAYKRLKKKHPRMAFGSLSKKAHAAARKKVK